MGTYTIVVIDDVRNPIPFDEGEMQVYRTWEDGLAALQEVHARDGYIDELWLDHDLGMDMTTGEEYNIMPIVEWLEEMGNAGTPLDVRWLFVHTSNFYRGDMMVKGLLRWYKNVSRAELPVLGTDQE